MQKNFTNKKSSGGKERRTDESNVEKRGNRQTVKWNRKREKKIYKDMLKIEALNLRLEDGVDETVNSGRWRIWGTV